MLTLRDELTLAHRDELTLALKCGTPPRPCAAMLDAPGFG